MSKIEITMDFRVLKALLEDNNEVPELGCCQGSFFDLLE